jgi:hypothetical protein
MGRIRTQIFDTSSKTDMSAVEGAEMFREITRQSVGTMSMADIQKLFPTFAKMQLILHATRNFSPEQTVDSTMSGRRQLPWPVDDNYLGRLRAAAGGPEARSWARSRGLECLRNARQEDQ